jgi:hypothetical protein
MSCAGHELRMREKINIYRYFTGKLEGIRPLGRASRAWEENIKKCLRETT